MLTFNGKLLCTPEGKCWDSIVPAPTPPYPFESVTIGTQTWTAKNIVYDDGQGGIQTLNVSDNGVNWGNQSFYQWNAAMRIAEAIPGWHLPSADEYQTLINFVGGEQVAGKKLKSTRGWDVNGNGTDDYGFTGTPSGYLSQGQSSSWYDVGGIGYMWSSTKVSAATGGDPNHRKCLRLYYKYDSAGVFGIHNLCWAPIRLIKDT